MTSNKLSLLAGGAGLIGGVVLLLNAQTSQAAVTLLLAGFLLGRVALREWGRRHRVDEYETSMLRRHFWTTALISIVAFCGVGLVVAGVLDVAGSKPVFLISASGAGVGFAYIAFRSYQYRKRLEAGPAGAART